MTDILEMLVKPSDQAVESRVGDETVLLHLENGTYYGLDAVGTRIWELIKDGVSPVTICAALAEEYRVPIASIETDTRRFLSDLQAHAIVTAS